MEIRKQTFRGIQGTFRRSQGGGCTGSDVRLFHDAGYKGLYDGDDVAKRVKNTPPLLELEKRDAKRLVGRPRQAAGVPPHLLTEQHKAGIAQRGQELGKDGNSVVLNKSESIMRMESFSMPWYFARMMKISG